MSRSPLLFVFAGALTMAIGLPAQSSATRESFLRLIDRPRVPLHAEEKLLVRNDAEEQIQFSFATETGQRVPGIIVKPRVSSGRKLPVVVALHGTGGSKLSQMPLLKELAAKGFLAVAIDGRYHGDRANGAKGSTAYVAAILGAYRGSGEHPFLYDAVWDIMRLIDWIETRSDADASRIGMIGFSKGGMELYLAAAVDSRIRVSVPCIGVQSFRWALVNESWHSRAGTFRFALDEAAKEAGVSTVDAKFLRHFYDRVAPGVYSEFDGPTMVPLIVPRPLLVINGDSDPRTPQPGLRECIRAAKEAYAAARATDAFEFHLQPDTGHKVTPQALQTAVEWFVRWLM